MDRVERMMAKADALGLQPASRGLKEYPIGSNIWFRSHRSRKWYFGTITNSLLSRGRRTYPMVQVNFLWASSLSKQQPDGLCIHRVSRIWSGRPHPCRSCRWHDRKKLDGTFELPDERKWESKS